jgi:glycosyltransferase involved in cell wall biosynthesis
MGFPEPFTFGIRAYRTLTHVLKSFDIVHDNQSLSYGVWALGKRVPTIATIHHPITVDRDLAVRSVRAFWKKIKHLRWHSFLRMQKIVARTLPHIITVSESAKKDVAAEFSIQPHRLRVVPNGINTDLFHPLADVERQKNRIIVTNSADIPLKGLYYLLQSIAQIVTKRPVKLVVIGSPKKNGGIENLIRKLGIGRYVHFTGRIDHDAFARQYARASVAVIPSLYEGFGLPAGEAMACGVPVVSTTGGALPEVVGDAGILVPPADSRALTNAILDLLSNPEKASRVGRAGYRRIQDHFTWENAARKTVDAYYEVIRAYRRF